MTPFERTDVVVAEQVSGHQLTIPVFRFPGDGTGPKVHLQASVHGAEVQGNAAIFSMLQQLSALPPQPGDITLIPHANPYGGNLKLGDYTYGRFDPELGENWNRVYLLLACRNASERTEPEQVDVAQFVAGLGDESPKQIAYLYRKALRAALNARLERAARSGLDYGRSLCLTLMDLSLEADIVMDLHTASRAPRYIYCPAYLMDEVHHFDIPNILEIPDDFAGSADETAFVPWWYLHDELARVGRAFPIPKRAFTLELGGQEWIDLEAGAEDAAGIMNYLHHCGAVNQATPPRLDAFQSCLLKDFVPIYAPRGGLLHWDVEPGESFEADARIGRLMRLGGLQEGEHPNQALTDVRAPKAGLFLHAHGSSAVNRGTVLGWMMTAVKSFPRPVS